MREEICKSLEYNNELLSYSPSIGVVLFPEHYGDAEYLIQCADKAMYDAKKAGGNQAVFYHSGIKLPNVKPE